MLNVPDDGGTGAPRRVHLTQTLVRQAFLEQVIYRLGPRGDEGNWLGKEGPGGLGRFSSALRRRDSV